MMVHLPAVLSGTCSQAERGSASIRRVYLLQTLAGTKKFIEARADITAARTIQSKFASGLLEQCHSQASEDGAVW